MLEAYNRMCKGCGNPITIWPTLEDGWRVRWRAFDRPIPLSSYRHDCRKYRALQAQRERRVLPTEQPARRYEQPARRSTVERRPTTFLTTFLARHKSKIESALIKLVLAFPVALVWYWLRHN
jgi:hypothetical protein